RRHLQSQPKSRVGLGLGKHECRRQLNVYRIRDRSRRKLSRRDQPTGGEERSHRRRRGVVHGGRIIHVVYGNCYRDGDLGRGAVDVHPQDCTVCIVDRYAGVRRARDALRWERVEPNDDARIQRVAATREQHLGLGPLAQSAEHGRVDVYGIERHRGDLHRLIDAGDWAACRAVQLLSARGRHESDQGRNGDGRTSAATRRHEIPSLQYHSVNRFDSSSLNWCGSRSASDHSAVSPFSPWLTIRSPGANSDSACRHAPHGAAGSAASLTSTNSENSRSPAVTAATSADRSAQIPTPNEAFSTLAPPYTLPVLLWRAAPT